MSKLRLEALSDAVFGIVLTLLVIEIRVPEIIESFTESKLIHGLEELLPLFFAYFLSFMILTTSWFTHQFFFSLMAKTLNRKLVNLNFIFLAFLSLIPFSSHLLGSYPDSRIAVFVYSLNITLMALLTMVIREYIYKEPSIENPDLKTIGFTKIDLVYGIVRIWISVFGAAFAVLMSFVDTRISIVVLILQAVILAVPGMVQSVTKLFNLDKIVKVDSHLQALMLDK
jgi:uncharacterized membrane protein